MQCELECGHCGYQFTLDAAELPRTTRCAVCGGVLAIVFPRVIPEPAPPPPPKPKPKPKPPAPAPAGADPVPGDRARRLIPLWKTVRSALNRARITADLTTVLFAAVTAMTLVAGPGGRSAPWWAASPFPVYVCGAFLLLAFVHAVCQCQCLSVPAAYGRQKVNTGLVLLACAGIGVFGWCPGWAGVAFVLASAAAVTASFGFWLAFLTQLGRRLGDDELADAARSYCVWFPFGLILFAGFLIAATDVPGVSIVLAWFEQAAAGVLGVVMSRLYANLLRLAVRAIDRRALAGSVAA